MMNKILFIDIDGVLVTPWSLSQPQIAIDDITYYEPYAAESVGALNMLIRHFNADIVIHSTRRYQYSLEEFKEIWKISGILFNKLSVLPRYGDMEDQWFNSPNEEKEYDLKRFIAKYAVQKEDYLILEDISLKMPNLYLVDSNTGLTTDDAEKIISLPGIDV
jgi:hypothetical protein